MWRKAHLPSNQLPGQTVSESTRRPARRPPRGGPASLHVCHLTKESAQNGVKPNNCLHAIGVVASLHDTTRPMDSLQFCRFTQKISSKERQSYKVIDFCLKLSPPMHETTRPMDGGARLPCSPRESATETCRRPCFRRQWTPLRPALGTSQNNGNKKPADRPQFYALCRARFLVPKADIQI